MNKKRSPRACFKVAPDSKMNDGDELLSVLERDLSARFDSVRVIKRRFFLRVRTISLQAGEKSFLVSFIRNRFDNNEWVLGVDQVYESLVRCFMDRKLNAQSSELRMISHDIHVLLASTPGFSAIRWYFEGRRTQRSAVATPDELGY